MLSDRDNIHNCDIHSVWHPYTRRSLLENEGIPIIEKADGPYLYDMDGTRYLDAISSWWCANLGHSHPKIVKAIQDQAAKLQHSILGSMSHPPAAALAEKLSALFTTPRHVHFASDGASAVEAALKIAYQFQHNRGQTQRTKIASLSGAYHGDTLATMTLGFIDSFHKAYKNVVGEAIQADAPCTGTCGVQDGNLACTLNCFESMRYLIESRGHELAGVIIEPLCQGASGIRIYSPDYIKALHDLCKEKDILLIADEIAVGFGRTGKMWACDHAGIEPDIMCIGKGLSAGSLPISAAIVHDDIYDSFSDNDQDLTFYHGHTFAGNPIAAAASLACMEVYESDNIVEQAEAHGRQMAEHLKPLQDCERVKQLRCLGMIAAIEFHDDGSHDGAASAQTVRTTLNAKGILVRPLGDVVYLMPPLNIEEAVLTECCDAFAEAVRSS